VTATNVFVGDGLVGRTGAANVYYVFDQQGNVAQRLNSSQSVTSSSTYDAYGAETTTGSPTDPFGYNAKWGYYTDRATGLALCTDRYYDSSSGRWLTRDPISYEGGINLFAYVFQSPTLRLDRYGDQAEEILEEAAPELIDKAAEVVEAVGGVLESAWEAATGEGECCAEEAAAAAGPGTSIVPYYPPNWGADASGWTETTLLPGPSFQRWGDLAGQFFAPGGAPPWSVSLPPELQSTEPILFDFTEPCVVKVSRAAPWFGQPGGGLQYFSPEPLSGLVGRGIVRTK
jgi:RHS repeat-associated protein